MLDVGTSAGDSTDPVGAVGGAAHRSPITCPTAIRHPKISSRSSAMRDKTAVFSAGVLTGLAALLAVRSRFIEGASMRRVAPSLGVVHFHLIIEDNIEEK